MFPKSILLCLAVCVCVQSFAEVKFISVKDEEWKTETLKTMEWVNSHLPTEWTKPKGFQIAYVPGTDPRYYPLFRYKKSDGTMEAVEKVLVVGSPDKAIFIHEYAHLIFDEWLRDTSVAWQYFLVWQAFNYNDLSKQLETFKNQIPSLEEIHQEAIDKQAAGDNSPLIQKMIENTARSIAKYKNNIIRINQALLLAENTPYPLDSVNSFEALQPYNELFADTLAAVLLEDWEVMKNATIEQLTATEDAPQIIVPPLNDKDEAMAVYLTYRDFLTGLTVDAYEFTEWESDSPYWQFAPVRSEIRGFHEVGALTSTQTISALGVAIRSVYEKLLIPYPKQLEASLKKKNSDLINAFEESLLPQ